MRRVMAVGGAALVIAVQAMGSPDRPSRRDAEAWLGRFAAGPEVLAFRWDDRLIADLGRISVPVDGQWHETVATFAVRHRLTWIAESGTITLEEQHNEGAHWRYELRLDADGRRLRKLEIPATEDGEPTVVRTYRRQP